MFLDFMILPRNLIFKSFIQIAGLSSQCKWETDFIYYLNDNFILLMLNIFLIVKCSESSLHWIVILTLFRKFKKILNSEAESRETLKQLRDKIATTGSTKSETESNWLWWDKKICRLNLSNHHQLLFSKDLHFLMSTKYSNNQSL